MAVFDATQNQVLFSPVSNFYQGNAIRAGLAAQEQDAELKGLQIEAAKDELANAPNKRAQAEKMWQMKYDGAKAQLDSALIENGEDTMNFMAKSLAPITAEATDLSIKGDVEAGVEYFNREIQRAKSTFPTPIAEKVKAGAGEDGVYQPEEIANMKMMLGAWLEREGGKRVPRDQLVDGQPTTVFYDPAGNMFYEDGKPVIGKVTPFATNEAGVIGSGVNPSGVSRNTIEFQDNVVGAVGAVQMGSELLTISEKNPEALGVPGGMARFGANLVSGAKAIADWAGYERPAPEDTEMQTMGASAFNYDSIDYDKLGISGAEAEKFRAGVYGIAFAAAVAEQGTRPTDKDIQQFIDQVGGRATSAQSFRETIVQFMRRQDRRLETIADVKQISETDRDAALAAWKPAFRDFMETYAKQAGLKVAENPETGEKLIQIDGKWEPY